ILLVESTYLKAGLAHVFAMNMYDPQLCYILDGFLGIYGLIITGMFIKEKVCLFLIFTADWILDLKGQDPVTYEPLRTGDPEGGRGRGLSSATRDTYDSLQMQSLPPR
uniref:T-cell surface glycoprotein CD3 zeta chain n=1 Tax=Neolamprologus brichardi TaxID=32507 RepID=A0A3Q4N8J7_NEOBR